MEFWDNIVQTALLGTDKRQLRMADMPADLQEPMTLIGEHDGDKEEQFLNMATVAANYRKCGMLPLQQVLDNTPAEPETNPYCSSAALRLLQDILQIESLTLLQLWVELCNKRGQIVLPDWLPALLSLAATHKHLRQPLQAVTGKRGGWLMQWNEDWKPVVQAEENIWDSGTPDQRKTYLKELRLTDPAKAKALLQQVWAKENANTKADLLTALHTGISNDDVPWLEELLNEKSQKVKDEALRLLKLCSQSSVVQLYQDVIKRSVVLKKERGIFGLGAKISISVNLPGDADEIIFKTGIEKIAKEKNANDADFILYQLLAAVPPSWLEEYLQLDRKEIVEHFQKTTRFNAWVPALGTAAIVFKDLDWLRTVLKGLNNFFYPEAFALLPNEETERFALQLLAKPEQATVVLNNLRYFENEWTPTFTRALLNVTVQNPYTYNRAFYSQYILHIPASIHPELDNYTPDNAYMKDIWSKTSEYIARLLTLKTQTQNAFKP